MTSIDSPVPSAAVAQRLRSYGSRTRPQAGVNGWVSLPTGICSFYRRGTCLRINCQFFHGSQAELTELSTRKNVLYRVNDGAVWYEDGVACNGAKAKSCSTESAKLQDKTEDLTSQSGRFYRVGNDRNGVSSSDNNNTNSGTSGSDSSNANGGENDEDNSGVRSQTPLQLSLRSSSSDSSTGSSAMQMLAIDVDDDSRDEPESAELDSLAANSQSGADVSGLFGQNGSRTEFPIESGTSPSLTGTNANSSSDVSAFASNYPKRPQSTSSGDGKTKLHSARRDANEKPPVVANFHIRVDKRAPGSAEAPPDRYSSVSTGTTTSGALTSSVQQGTSTESASSDGVWGSLTKEGISSMDPVAMRRSSRENQFSQTVSKTSNETKESQSSPTEQSQSQQNDEDCDSTASTASATSAAQGSPTPSNTSHPVACLAYLSGCCARENCRFVHLRDDVRLLPKHVCAYHHSPGGCSKKNRCRYFHGTSDELKTMREDGVLMYNPKNNTVYKTIPDELEDEPTRRRRAQCIATAAAMKEAADPGLNSCSSGSSSSNSNNGSAYHSNRHGVSVKVGAPPYVHTVPRLPTAHYTSPTTPQNIQQAPPPPPPMYKDGNASAMRTENKVPNVFPPSSPAGEPRLQGQSSPFMSIPSSNSNANPVSPQPSQCDISQLVARLMAQQPQLFQPLIRHVQSTYQPKCQQEALFHAIMLSTILSGTKGSDHNCQPAMQTSPDQFPTQPHASYPQMNHAHQAYKQPNGATNGILPNGNVPYPGMPFEQNAQHSMAPSQAPLSAQQLQQLQLIHQLQQAQQQQQQQHQQQVRQQQLAQAQAEQQQQQLKAQQRNAMSNMGMLPGASPPQCARGADSAYDANVAVDSQHPLISNMSPEYVNYLRSLIGWNAPNGASKTSVPVSNVNQSQYAPGELDLATWATPPSQTYQSPTLHNPSGSFPGSSAANGSPNAYMNPTTYRHATNPNEIPTPTPHLQHGNAQRPAADSTGSLIELLKAFAPQSSPPPASYSPNSGVHGNNIPNMYSRNGSHPITCGAGSPTVHPSQFFSGISNRTQQ